MYRDPGAKKGNHPAGLREPDSAPAQAQPFQAGRALRALPEEGVFPSAINISLPQAPLSCLTLTTRPGTGTSALLVRGINYEDPLHEDKEEETLSLLL